MNKRIFCNRSEDLLKTIHDFSFRTILEMGSETWFSLSRQNVMFICLIKYMKMALAELKV